MRFGTLTELTLMMALRYHSHVWSFFSFQNSDALWSVQQDSVVTPNTMLSTWDLQYIYNIMLCSCIEGQRRKLLLGCVIITLSFVQRIGSAIPACVLLGTGSERKSVVSHITIREPLLVQHKCNTLKLSNWTPLVSKAATVPSLVSRLHVHWEEAWPS